MSAWQASEDCHPWLNWVDAPRRCSKDAVWVAQTNCEKGTVRELVHKPLYQTWFYDTCKDRAQNAEQPLRWDEISNKRVLHALDSLGNTPLGVNEVGNSVTYKIKGQTYRATVCIGFKPWQLVTHGAEPCYQTSKFYTSDGRVGSYKVPINSGMPVDKSFGVPLLARDRRVCLVTTPAATRAKAEDSYSKRAKAEDPYSLENLLTAKRKRQDLAEKIALKCDEQAAAMMDNGIKINPTLKKMYGATAPLSRSKPVRVTAPEAKFSDMSFVPGANNAYTAGREIDQFDAFIIDLTT